MDYNLAESAVSRIECIPPRWMRENEEEEEEQEEEGRAGGDRRLIKFSSEIYIQQSEYGYSPRA